MDNLNEREIQNILKSFRKRTGIICSTLFTEDGFVIALDKEKSEEMMMIIKVFVQLVLVSLL